MGLITEANLCNSGCFYVGFGVESAFLHFSRSKYF